MSLQSLGRFIKFIESYSISLQATLTYSIYHDPHHYDHLVSLFNEPSPIGLYREIAIAIQKESGDSNGGNV